MMYIEKAFLKEKQEHTKQKSQFLLTKAEFYGIIILYEVQNTTNLSVYI